MSTSTFHSVESSVRIEFEVQCYNYSTRMYLYSSNVRTTNSVVTLVYLYYSNMNTTTAKVQTRHLLRSIYYVL